MADEATGPASTDTAGGGDALRELSEQEKSALTKLEALGRELQQFLDGLGVSHELLTASDKIEQGLAWARKHIIEGAQ